MGYFTIHYHFYILAANEKKGNEPNDSTALWKDLGEGKITNLIQGFHFII